MNPYSILGLPINTDFNEVRAKYFYLARKHHPDKLSKDLSIEEKKKNEDYFKTITVAYNQIEKRTKNGGIDFENDNEIDLANIWKQVENFFNKPETWECMKEILNKVSNIDKSKKTKIKPPRKHNIKLKLSLEDIHNSKVRKLRLFLSGIDSPIYISINSTDIFKSNTIEINNYKIDKYDAEIDIMIQLSIEKHKEFRLMRFADRWDVFYDLSISWEDYINGKKLIINYLNNKATEIVIPPYYNNELPIVMENMGLAGNGDLFIVIKINNPKNFEEFKETLNYLNALVMEPRVLRTKSI
jgi:DnaJ-class molecular chaperone